MDEIKFAERLTKVEERSKSNSYQIGELKPIVTEIHTMTQTMVKLIEQVKNISDNVDDLKQKMGVLEKEPSARLAQIKTAIITALTTALISGIVSAIFLFK